MTLNNAAGVSLSNAGGTSNLTLGNASGGGIDLVAGALIVGSNTLTTVDGLTFVSGTSGTFTSSAGSNFIFNQNSGATSSFGTIRLTPGSETVNNLTVNLPAPTRIGVLKLGTNCTVAGTLTLTAGTIQTGASILTVNGPVVRSNGKVFGSLQKPVGPGAVSKTFETGDTLAYAPITVSFANVSTGGSLTASTTIGKHPNLLTSGLDTTKTLGRYYTLTNSGVAFTTYSATFGFVPADALGGANTANFVVKKYDVGTWTSPTTTIPLATSISATGMTSFSDFAVGEPSGSGTNATTFSLNGGWNLVSVPRSPSNPSVTVLFPGALSGTVNSFLSGAYTQPSTLNTGEGYWAFYGAPGSNSISGTSLTSASVTITTGNRWVLVGSITASVLASKLTSNPSGAIVGGTLNSFNGSSYSTPTTLDPGKGYWVFVNAPCTLTISQ